MNINQIAAADTLNGVTSRIEIEAHIAAARWYLDWALKRAASLQGKRGQYPAARRSVARTIRASRAIIQLGAQRLSG